MKKKLIFAIILMAVWWYTPKSLWWLGLLFLVVALNLIGGWLVKIYRRNFGTLKPEQAFDLVYDVLQPRPEHPADQFRPSWCEVLQVYARQTPTAVREMTKEEKEEQLVWRNRSSERNEQYAQAENYGLIVEDKYSKYGEYVLTELGVKYGELGPLGGYEFYLNILKRWSLESVRNNRHTASATFVLEFERTELAVALKHQPVLRRTFEMKTERTNTGDWLLTELIETGLPNGPELFPLEKFRNWQAYLDAERRKQEERGKWHDDPAVKSALERYTAEADPEKKRILYEESGARRGRQPERGLGLNSSRCGACNWPTGLATAGGAQLRAKHCRDRFRARPVRYKKELCRNRT